MGKYAHGEYMFLVFEDDFNHEEFIRGHVSKEEAQAAINEYYGDEDHQIETIRHAWGRFVFAGESICDYDRELKVYSEPSRGAFPLTECHYPPMGSLAEAMMPAKESHQ